MKHITNVSLHNEEHLSYFSSKYLMGLPAKGGVSVEELLKMGVVGFYEPERIYYKLLSRDLKSWNRIGIDDSMVAVQYEADKFVKPLKEHTRLFVFERVEDALSWATCGRDRIFECLIDNDPEEKVGDFLVDAWGTFVSRWVFKKEKSEPLKRIPNGSVAAKAVKITKEIHF